MLCIFRCLPFIHQTFIHQCCIFFGIHHFCNTVDLCNTELTGERNFSFTGITTFCSHKDNSVRSTYTINGSSRCIFQYGNTFYFVRVDLWKVTFDAIYHNQRRSIVHRSTATNIECGSVFTGTSAGLTCYQSRNTSCQTVCDTGSRTLFQFPIAHSRNRSGNRYLFLLPISYNHYFVQGLCVIMESYGKCLSIFGNGNFHSFHSYHWNSNNSLVTGYL